MSLQKLYIKNKAYLSYTNNLIKIKTEDIENFIAKVGAAYKEKIGYAADFYVVDIGDGAGVLK